jgi:hypothetical protein
MFEQAVGTIASSTFAACGTFLAAGGEATGFKI